MDSNIDVKVHRFLVIFEREKSIECSNENQKTKNNSFF